MVYHKIPMTPEGSEKLRQELHNLKTLDRLQIIKDIATARAHGDLKENAEYHAAREQQSFIESRILEIENKLSNAQIINISKLQNEGKVIFGSTVKLICLNNSIELKYKIVGEDEADLKANKISVISPIAKAMIGKYKNDKIDVKAPGGLMSYKINAVEYI